jgi:hypothetical protein
MMNDRLYGQISYNCSLSNAFKLKLGHNLNPLVVEMKAATAKDITEHIVGPVRRIPACLDPVSDTQLLICILKLRRELMIMKEWWMRRQVGKELIVVLLYVLSERIELIIFHKLAGSKCISVKNLTSRCISGAPEYEHISQTYRRATERYHCG